VDKRILIQGRRRASQRALPNLPLQPLLCDNIVPLTDKSPNSDLPKPPLLDPQSRDLQRLHGGCASSLDISSCLPRTSAFCALSDCLMLSQLCGRPTRPRTARFSAHTVSGVLATGKIKQCFVTNRPTYRQVPLDASCVSGADCVSIFLELIHGGDVQVAWIWPLGHHTETP
jgi:hypothetical protein